MPELELTRTSGKTYALPGVGTVRLEGVFSRVATAQASGSMWHFAPTGFWRRTIEATDAAGSVVGAFVPHGLRRGGEVRWAGRDLALRPSSSWRERYALADGDRELAALDGKGWGRRPVKIAVDDLGAIDPGLLLFTAFVVRRLASDAASAAAGGSTAAVG